MVAFFREGLAFAGVVAFSGSALFWLDVIVKLG